MFLQVLIACLPRLTSPSLKMLRQLLHRQRSFLHVDELFLFVYLLLDFKKPPFLSWVSTGYSTFRICHLQDLNVLCMFPKSEFFFVNDRRYFFTTVVPVVKKDQIFFFFCVLLNFCRNLLTFQDVNLVFPVPYS
jgi:hypothetical protein